MCLECAFVVTADAPGFVLLFLLLAFFWQVIGRHWAGMLAHMG
jgi:hypothetical protein